MNSKLIKINGYLEALSNMNTFLGNCYGHQYSIVELNVNINDAVRQFNLNSNLSHHNSVEIIDLEEMELWEDRLFTICTHWFFSIYKMRNIFLGEVCYTDGKVVSMENDKEYNKVSQQLITLIRDLISGSNVKVYKLSTNPAQCDDEFEWEQVYFDVGSRVYVLDFYQWG